MCDSGEGQRKNRFVFLNVFVYKAVKELDYCLIHSAISIWKLLKYKYLTQKCHFMCLYEAIMFFISHYIYFMQLSLAAS